TPGSECSTNDFRPNPGRIADCDSDAFQSGASSQLARQRIASRKLAPLESFDVGLLPQAREPAFLHALRFFLLHFLLDFSAHFGKRARHPTAFIFDLEDVIISAQFDDIADLS